MANEIRDEDLAKISHFTLKPNDIYRNKLFGFSGKFGSGKDTVAKILKETIKDYCPIATVETISMAMPLKRLVGMIDGRLNFCVTDEEKSMKPSESIFQTISLQDLINVTIPKSVTQKYKLNEKLDMLKSNITEIFKTSNTMGQVLQRVGTELFRKQIGDRFWIDCWKSEAMELLNSGCFVFCTDIRFPNEKDALEDLGGTVIRIDCPLEIRKQRITTIRDPNHESETSLDHIENWEYKMSNDSDLPSLKSQVLDFFHLIAIF